MVIGNRERKIMITLENDQLKFSFPEVRDRLDSYYSNHKRKILREILDSDVDSILKNNLTSDDIPGDVTLSDASKRLNSASKGKLIDLAECFLDRQWRYDFSNQGPALTVTFKRTLRIPDDGKSYPLPPELGDFPLRHVDDFDNKLPEEWIKKGGIILPIYQAEAMWLEFSGHYTCAVKVASGKINCITGEEWEDGLSKDPQNYVMTPDQPWLDGFCVEKGRIKQFVAVPLGSGFTVEEQISQAAEHGGLQFEVFPIKPEIAFKDSLEDMGLDSVLYHLISELEPSPPKPKFLAPRAMRSAPMPAVKAGPCAPKASMAAASPIAWKNLSAVETSSEDSALFQKVFSKKIEEPQAMGFGMGGTMKQEIYEDLNKPEDYCIEEKTRCFVHMTSTFLWKAITGEIPPLPPEISSEYQEYGGMWFDYMNEELAVLNGSKDLSQLKSIAELESELKAKMLPENQSISVEKVKQLWQGKQKGQVKEWENQ